MFDLVTGPQPLHLDERWIDQEGKVVKYSYHLVSLLQHNFQTCLAKFYIFGTV